MRCLRHFERLEDPSGFLMLAVVPDRENQSGADLRDRYQAEIDFRRLGEQSLENISQFLGSVHFGVATTPLSLIGKSSCTAAMLDHGLPVIVNRNDVHFRGIPEVARKSELLIPSTRTSSSGLPRRKGSLPGRGWPRLPHNF